MKTTARNTHSERLPSDYLPLRISCLLLAGMLAACALAAQAAEPVRRIFIVDSYNKEYIWSQSTHAGVAASMLKAGYLANAEEAKHVATRDKFQNNRVVIEKFWMDTKRKNSREDIAKVTLAASEQIRKFKPDLILLGDDNAANYIGNQFLDTKIPVVFWGINGLPLKYGLIQSLDTPGRNVTGVWQAGYHKESLDLLKRLVPKAKTFVILACDSESSRPNIKMIELLSERGILPLKLVGKVVTNSYEEFTSETLKWSKKVDAFFVLNHDTLRDRSGKHVDVLKVGRWYLTNIFIPEASHEDQFVMEGMLLTANDSGHNQGSVAFEMAASILDKGLSPARMAVRVPERGPYMVNRNRAKALGLSLEQFMYLIDQVVEKSLALER